MPRAEIHSLSHEDSLCLLYQCLSEDHILKQVHGIAKEYLPKRDHEAAEHKENFEKLMAIRGSVKDSKEIHLPEYVCCF